MYVRLADGAELFYTIDDFTDPWTQPETIVLHHGMAKNHRFWYRWVPVLAAHYRVLRFDMRGMGQSSVPEPGYPWSLTHFAEDLLGLLDQLGLEKVHLIGETVGGSIAMHFATAHQERLLSLAVCTSPVTFDAHHTESADMIDREGMTAWVESSISRRLDPQLAAPAYRHWYASQMAATPAHVVSGFQRQAGGGDLRPGRTDDRVSDCGHGFHPHWRDLTSADGERDADQQRARNAVRLLGWHDPSHDQRGGRAG